MTLLSSFFLHLAKLCFCLVLLVEIPSLFELAMKVLIENIDGMYIFLRENCTEPTCLVVNDCIALQGCNISCTTKHVFNNELACCLH